MKMTILSALAGSALVVCSLSAHERGGDWPVRDQETVQKTLTLNQAPMRLAVDNVRGYVHVKGVSGSEVRLIVHKTIRAESDSDLSRAKAEVDLKITQGVGSVSAYYDAPWRCKGEGSGCHDSERRFYSVVYDIDIEVPAAARVVISDVNNGDIQVNNTSGDFEVSGTNGGIHMAGVSGSGSVHTINGPVSVHFAKNPVAPCSFKSINGALDVWFQPALSADLLLKTFNGQVYSDFEVAPRAVKTAGVAEQRDGMFVYHNRGFSGGRAGHGGPELTFDAFNSAIRLHEEK